MTARMGIEQAVARAVSGATDAGDAYARALRAVADGDRLAARRGLGAGAVDPDVLRCVATWAADDEAARAFAQTTCETALRSGEGLPGRVWQSGRAIWVDGRCDRRPAARAGPPRQAAGHACGGRASRCAASAASSASSRSSARARASTTPDLVATLEVVGAQLGQVVERRRAEDSQRASEQRHRATLQAALDCVVTMDHHGRVVEFNPAAERTFGYPSGRRSAARWPS